MRAGLVWIGPPPAAIRAMGEKTAARRACRRPACPWSRVPWSRWPSRRPPASGRGDWISRSSSRRRRAAGGRGCGWSRGPAELEAAFAAASREAPGSVRRSGALPRAVHPRGAARRDPGPGRRVRPRDPPRRAGVLAPAPASEGARGVSCARPRPGDCGSGWARSPSARRRPSGTWARARSSSCSRPTTPSGSSR